MHMEYNLEHRDTDVSNTHSHIICGSTITFIYEHSCNDVWCGSIADFHLDILGVSILC